MAAAASAAAEAPRVSSWRRRGLNPASGPAGTVLTFSGVHLGGWRANVLLLDHALATEQQLDGDTFTVTVPAGVAPGFYDVRVDVSHLFRRSFLFEVTS